MGRIRQYLTDLVFPARCLFCREKLPYRTEMLFCDDCLLRYTRERAAVCAIEAGSCYYALRYRAEVRRAILTYKFRKMPQYDRPLGALLAQSLRHLQGIDCITYVPVSSLRLMTRGYDQSRLLAEAVGRELQLPVRSLLRKIRHTRPQSRVSGARRRAHVQGVFAARHTESIYGKTILLIDDIVTTGSTISACAAVLEREGARVICAALAHGT